RRALPGFFGSTVIAFICSPALFLLPVCPSEPERKHDYECRILKVTSARAPAFRPRTLRAAPARCDRGAGIQDIANSTVNGNSLQRTSGCEGCPGGGLSQQQIVSGDGYVEFTASETNLMRYVGLSAPNASLADGNDTVPLTSGDRFR